MIDYDADPGPAYDNALKAYEEGGFNAGANVTSDAAQEPANEVRGHSPTCDERRGRGPCGCGWRALGGAA